MSIPAITAISYSLFMTTVVQVPVCFFQLVCGSACPTCGTTRSLAFICRGRFAEAFNANPVGFVLLVILIRYGVTQSDSESRLSQWLVSDRVSLFILTAFFACGIFGIVMRA